MSVNIGKSIRGIFKHVLTVSFFFSHILIPLGVLSFYLVFSSWLLPVGVNKVFATRSAQYLTPITLSIFIAFFAIIGSRRNKQPLFNPSGGDLSARDLILLLFPLTPVMQYILNNVDILSLYEIILIFCIFVLLVSLPIIVVPTLIRRTGSVRPVVSLGLAFAFSITIMASLSKQFAWHEWGSLKIQLAVFGSVWLISWLMFQLNFRNLVYLLVIVLFSTNSIFQVFVRDDTQSTPAGDETENMLVTLIGSRKPVITPNIYLLVYDSYVVSETMSAYGIDNQPQEQYLKDLGFKIYPHTYSMGGETLTSMSPVLNVSNSYYGDMRRGVSGDGIVQNLLGKFGYRTYGVFASDFNFRGITPSYDYSFPGYDSPVNLLIEAILVGEFRFDINYDKVSEEEFIQEKKRIFSAVSENPKFIYTHSDMPNHSQNSGICLPNEVELYRQRLARANFEMRNDIEFIIENDPNSIVIVAGDHGPYLTKNCTITGGHYDISEISRLDIQDRFGAFLAIRWPSLAFEEYDDITVLQDLFSAIFAYIFADKGLLESKVEAINSDNWYISGAAVADGIIEGGINNGEALFTGTIER